MNKFIIPGLPNLHNLDLSHNLISEIDGDAFKFLHNLRELNLHKNKVADISDWTSPLLNLRVLDISQNALVHLSTPVNLHNLQVLNLSDNLLVDIDRDTLSRQTTLRTLDVSYNKLVRFPRVPSLRDLNMSGNSIRTLNQHSLQGLSSLHSLYLEKMKFLPSVEPLAFIDCHNLTVLSLSKNPKLAPLPPQIFQTTPQLATLDISHLPWTSLSSDQVN